MLGNPNTRKTRSKTVLNILSKPPGPLLASSVKDEQVMLSLDFGRLKVQVEEARARFLPLDRRQVFL